MLYKKKGKVLIAPGVRYLIAGKARRGRWRNVAAVIRQLRVGSTLSLVGLKGPKQSLFSARRLTRLHERNQLVERDAPAFLESQRGVFAAVLGAAVYDAGGIFGLGALRTQR